MPITRRSLSAALALAAILAAGAAWPQTVFPTPQGNQNAPGFVNMCPTQSGNYVPCGQPGAMPFPVVIVPSGPVAPPGYPVNSIPITGNATGSTSAVVGTLAARPGATTYICGFDVSAIGGTAAVGPVTVAGLVGSSMVYQMSSTAAGLTLSRTFTPCIPASAVNTAITITTTADGTATAVDVNSWGFQL
jgi:hypothetical protein